MSIFKKKVPSPKKIILIQGSLNPYSKTSIVVDAAKKILEERGIFYEYFDIRSFNMDFCNGRPLQEYNEDTQRAYHILSSGDGYIFGMPVYAHSMSGALKNLIDIAKSAFNHKVAGVLCNSSGVQSYLASIDLIKILLLEANAVTIQPIVHTYPESFKGAEIFDDEVFRVMNEMIEALLRFIATHSSKKSSMERVYKI